MNEMIKNKDDQVGSVPVNVKVIQSLVYTVRGKQVMLDSDLAMLYEVETKRLNESMKRNKKRFPDERFCFQLSNEEIIILRSQIATSSEQDGPGGRRYNPYVYTEQGIAMLSAILKSEKAITVSIGIMDAFVEMRHFIANNALMFERISAVELKQLEYQKRSEEKFDQIFEYISDHEESNQKIFFDGQIFDAFSLLTEIIIQANKSIILIDGYVDVVTLNILAKKKTGVDVTFYTLPSAGITALDIVNFNAQYPNLEVKRTTAFHDRFLIIDKVAGYHIGASLKDAGKKCFGINRIEDIGVINDLIQRAELTS